MHTHLRTPACTCVYRHVQTYERLHTRSWIHKLTARESKREKGLYDSYNTLVVAAFSIVKREKGLYT